MSAGLAPPRPIQPEDKIDAFDCGDAVLNEFLRRHALANQRANAARTYVMCEGDTVVGFYSLAAGSVIGMAAPPRVTRGLARHRVPVMVLARLAVDRKHQRQGLGQLLLSDALVRTLQAAAIAGIRCLFVHAKDDDASAWYAARGFTPSPVDPHQLFLLLKDAAALLE